MPKLKSLLAGIAIGSAALSGSVVTMGAMTSAANAETGVSTSSSILAGGCGHGGSCGWGWGGRWRHHHRHHRIRVKVHVHNNNHTNNHNDNRRDIEIERGERGAANGED